MRKEANVINSKESPESIFDFNIGCGTRVVGTKHVLGHAVEREKEEKQGEA